MGNTEIQISSRSRWSRPSKSAKQAEKSSSVKLSLVRTYLKCLLLNERSKNLLPLSVPFPLGLGLTALNPTNLGLTLGSKSHLPNLVSYFLNISILITYGEIGANLVKCLKLM